jgi:hypothetical protein
MSVILFILFSFRCVPLLFFWNLFFRTFLNFLITFQFTSAVRIRIRFIPIIRLTIRKIYAFSGTLFIFILLFKLLRLTAIIFWFLIIDGLRRLTVTIFWTFAIVTYRLGLKSFFLYLFLDQGLYLWLVLWLSLWWYYNLLLLLIPLL